jgi:hypothetical protein
MTSPETIAQIRDLVVIAFMTFMFVVLLLASVLGLRVYRRLGDFMDRMDRVATEFETTFGRIAAARKAVEEITSVLQPLFRGLGLVGLARRAGRFFGGKSNKSDVEQH